MKTLAAITAIFYPLGFVASLFSMNMFSWQSTSSAAPQSVIFVSSYFWVYWVVAVPLTVVVVYSWRKWWLHEAAEIRRELALVDRPGRKRSGQNMDTLRFRVPSGTGRGMSWGSGDRWN